MPRSSKKNKQVRNIVNSPLKSSPPVFPPLSQNTPSLATSIKEGFAFGLGSSIARNIVDTVMFRRQEPKIAPNTEGPTVNKEYMKCMQESDNDYEGCKSKLGSTM